MKDEPEMKMLVEAITSYRTMLKLLNINDEQVHLFKKSWSKQLFFLFLSLIRLLFSLLFVLPGNIMLFPLSAAVSFYAENERIKALKASTVKVKANDVLASIKTLAYISTFPIYLGLFTYIFNRVLRWYYEFSRAESYTYTLIFFLVFPALQLISIRSHHGAQQHYNEFQGRFLSLFYPNQVELIRTARSELKKKVEKAVNDVGPKVFPNFDKLQRIAKDPMSYSMRQQEKQRMKKSASNINLRGHHNKSYLGFDQNFNPAASTREGDLGISMFSSRKTSFEEPTPSATDYNLDYIEELELNKAFNVFKDF